MKYGIEKGHINNDDHYGDGNCLCYKQEQVAVTLDYRQTLQEREFVRACHIHIAKCLHEHQRSKRHGLTHIDQIVNVAFFLACAKILIRQEDIGRSKITIPAQINKEHEVGEECLQYAEEKVSS